MANEISTYKFKKAKDSFTECRKLFPSYKHTIRLILQNGLKVNSFIRNNYLDLDIAEIDQLDEIRRDVLIYRSRIDHIMSKMKKCATALKSLAKTKSSKKRDKKQDSSRSLAWVNAYLECLDLRGEFDIGFRQAEHKWAAYETAIMEKRN